MNEHVDDLAELYALGSLEDLDRARVERHTSSCAACAERVSEAEESVTRIAELQTMHEAPPGLRTRLHSSLALAHLRHAWVRSIPAAIAAALVLALIPTWVAVDRTRTVAAMHQDEQALAKIASAPFARAQFMSPRNAPMDAKVLYGMHGDWYYVVVMHPKPGMQVAYVHEGKMEMLGTVATHGASGTLYLPVNHKMEELALVSDGAVIGDAHLAY